MHCFRNIVKHDRILCKENTCRWGFLWLMLSLQTPNFRIEHQTRQIWTRTAKQRCAATAETYLKLLLFFGVHSLHGCSAILRVAFYWSLPSAQCLLQNQKKFQLSLPLWFCSMSACACLLLFSTLCTGAAKALFPKKNKHHMLRMLAACTCRQGATPAELASELGRAAAGWKNDEV